MPLTLVSVPLGNLEDITLRSLRLLREADLILCEDTRNTAHLLELLNLPQRPLLSLHEYNEVERLPQVMERLSRQENLVLVSDAGTPAVSDPGFKLVRAVVEAGISVCPAPGPCAAIAALSASGLPTDRFRFLGFPPTKQAALKQMLEELKEAEETLIFYISPHQTVDFLKVACEVFGGDRPAVLARELTKVHEEFLRGTLLDLSLMPGSLLGERVLLVGGCPEEEAPQSEQIEAVVQSLLDSGYTVSRAAKEAANRIGCKRKDAYLVALKLTGEA